jgi:hypothetical protein
MVVVPTDKDPEGSGILKTGRMKGGTIAIKSIRKERAILRYLSTRRTFEEAGFLVLAGKNMFRRRIMKITRVNRYAGHICHLDPSNRR